MSTDQENTHASAMPFQPGGRTQPLGIGNDALDPAADLQLADGWPVSLAPHTIGAFPPIMLSPTWLTTQHRAQVRRQAQARSAA